jgi:hypothetical protein
VTEVDSAISLEVPSMLLCVWDRPTRGQYAPEFRQDVGVGNVLGGVMEYNAPASWLSEADREGLADA